MEDTLGLSNRTGGNAAAPAAALAAGLDAWRAGLGKWLATLRAYSDEVGNSGVRILGARWSAAEKSIEAAAADLDAHTDLALRCDALEAATRALEAASQVWLDPNVQFAVASGMSRTFSENVRGLVKAIRACAAASLAHLHAALQTASELGGLAEFEFDPAAVHGGVSTELYLGRLRCQRDLAGLEKHKYLALGCEAKSASTFSKADSAAELAGLHPLQRMAYLPVVATGVEATANAAANAPVTVSLPQASLAVKYDILPLIGRAAALKFGPVAPMVSGLNYNLVKRLRTIQAMPANRQPVGEVHEGEGIHEGVLVCDIGADTPMRLAPPPGTSRWLPFGGADPRVAAYSEICTTIIEARLDPDWKNDDRGATLVEQYSSAIEQEPRETPETQVVDALLAAFSDALDEEGCADAAAFRTAIGQSPEMPRYISTAMIRLGRTLLSRMLDKLMMRSQLRAPLSVVAVEARIAQAPALMDAAQALGRQIRDLPVFLDNATFRQPAVQRRETLLVAARQSFTAAAAAAQVNCLPPCLLIHTASTAPPPRW